MVIDIILLALAGLLGVILVVVLMMRQPVDKYRGAVVCHKNGCIENAVDDCGVCKEAFCVKHMNHQSHANDEHEPVEWDLE